MNGKLFGIPGSLGVSKIEDSFERDQKMTEIEMRTGFPLRVFFGCLFRLLPTFPNLAQDSFLLVGRTPITRLWITTLSVNVLSVKIENLKHTLSYPRHGGLDKSSRRSTDRTGFQKLGM